MLEAKYNNTKIIPKEYLPSLHNKKIYCPYCDNIMLFINWIINTEYTIWWKYNYRRADIYIEFLYNNTLYKTIIEVQLSYNNFEEINDRTIFYKNHWIDNIIWICTLEKSWLTLNFNEVQKHIIYYIKEWILWYAYYKKELNQIIQNNYSKYKDYSFYYKKIINEKQKINKNDSFIENIKLNKLWYDFLISWNSNYLEQIIDIYNEKEDLKVIEHNKKLDEDERKLHESIKNSKTSYKVNSNYSYNINNNSSSINKTYTPYEEELKIDFKLKLENNDIIDKEISVWDYVIVNNFIKILKKWIWLKKFNARQSFYRVKEVINWICIWNSNIKDKEEYWYCRNWFKKEELINVSKECYLKNFWNH